MIGEYDQFPEKYTRELQNKISKAFAGDRETSDALLEEAADYLTSAGRPIIESRTGEELKTLIHPDLNVVRRNCDYKTSQQRETKRYSWQAQEGASDWYTQ
ncbi:MAG: hypothetical protein GY792_18385 [Gammaproteobacteria bacterium]|nr:hypothetical protein [Gammaproteobacteria bacterium]